MPPGLCGSSLYAGRMQINGPRGAIHLAAIVSLVMAISICGVKFIGYYLTDSAAILSDALESINNIFTALFALFSVRQSFKHSDRDFLYGRGRIEYFSAGFEGALIGVAGLLILNESVPRLLRGSVPMALEQGLLLVTLAALLNGLLGWYLIRTGRKHHSAALVADGVHVMTDLVTSIVVLIALGLVALTGWDWLDPLVACALGLWLLWTGFRIARTSFFHLMDRISPDLLERVVRALRENRRPDLIYPHRLRVREIGQRLFIDLHCFVPRYFTVEQTHALETGFAADVQATLGQDLDFLMHIDPCRSDHCLLCPRPACAVRGTPQVRQVAWTATGLMAEPGPVPGHQYPDLRTLDS